MPELTLSIGGRNFVVACEPGEEPQLEQAAALLNAEAATLVNELGHIPESRMLLMAGLMLADRTIEVAEQAQASMTRVETLEGELQQAQAAGGDPAVAEALHAQADAARGALAKATARVEALAAKVGT